MRITWRFIRLSVFAALLPVLANAQSVALTFDDGFDSREQPEAAAWSGALLKGLAAGGVTSMVFAAGARVDSPAGLVLVNDWGLAGHAIANHTYSHWDLNAHATKLSMFIHDVERNEALRLQRKELLPRPRSDRDAVGDRVAEQIIQRTGLRICGEPGILEVALDQAATFQRASNASGDLLYQLLQIAHLAEHQSQCFRIGRQQEPQCVG